MTCSSWNIVFGPPGTGKTTFGMNFVEDQIKRGIDPSRIGYIAFTRRAANEARERAQKNFNLTDDDLTFFNLQKFMKVHFPNKEGVYPTA